MESKKLPPVVYIAGPFRAASAYVDGQQDSWGIMQNVMAAAELSLAVWRLGAVGLCPHMNTFCFQNAAPDNVWLDGDLALLAKCDAVLMTDDWERSSGARAEFKFAKDRGIPVFVHIDQVDRWLSARLDR
jgi:nucleoside 2-deoxyribosyltransferase